MAKKTNKNALDNKGYLDRYYCKLTAGKTALILECAKIDEDKYLIVSPKVFRKEKGNSWFIVDEKTFKKSIKNLFKE